MSIPDYAVNYIRFALQEIRHVNLAIRGEARLIPDAIQEKWLLNQSACLDKAERYIEQAMEEVQDGTEPADETTTAGNSGREQ